MEIGPVNGYKTSGRACSKEKTKAKDPKLKDRTARHMHEYLHKSYIAKANKSFGAGRMSIVYDLVPSESSTRFIR